MSVPKTMKAYTVRRNLFWPFQALFSSAYANQPEFVERPVPTPADDELLVKVETFAANPTDTLHLDYIGASGSIIGCDFVGTVVSAGPRASRHKAGDKVCGVVHGGKFPAIGSAAEYCVIGDDVTMSVPEGWSNEDAATLGVPFLTAAAILYDSQGVPQPPAKVALPRDKAFQHSGWTDRADDEPWYFVSGGATSVGLFVIQLARLAGFKVVASCSPKSFDLVKSYGADLVVSYHDTEAALSQIKEATTGGPGVKFGADCVGGKPNVRFAVDAFGPEGGLLTSIIPGGKPHRKDVKIDQVLLYRYLGKAFSFIPLISTFPSEPEKRRFLADWVAKSPQVIEQYGIKPNPVDVSKGWEALPAGWDKLRKKQVSGKKLVFDLK